MYGFEGRTAIVTGGGAGLGLATAKRLAAEGATIGIVDVHPPSAAAAVEELTGSGASAIALSGDVSSPEDVDRVVAEVERTCGGVDFLVNNAGITVIKPFVDHTVEDIDRQLAVNLRGASLMMRRVLPGMIARGSGAIVNISSAAALHFTVPHAAYAATKAGVIALTRDVAFEVARLGIRVNGIAPGLIAVPPSATKQPNLAGKDAADGRDLHAPTSTRPLGHGKPEDIANVVAFLCSSEARFIVGVTIPVAGGTDLQVTMAFPGE